MIKIDIDSCIFVDGDARCEGTVRIQGDVDNLTLEIYTILKTFANQCPDVFDSAVERHMMELMTEEV